jgi:AhpD family alkylhydroperoxidase
MTLTDSMRVDLSASPEGYRVTSAIDNALHQAGVDVALFSLVAYRVSQLNGCAYCIDMHSKDAFALGDTEQRPFGVAAWHDADLFSHDECAALALADVMTTLDRDALATAVANASERLSPETAAQLAYSIAAANAWNRIAITSKPPVGAYESKLARAARRVETVASEHRPPT